jgi:hypothetical protein
MVNPMRRVGAGRGAVVALAMCAAIAAAGCRGPTVPAESAERPAAAARTLTPAQIAERATPAIVTVRTARSMGTGFIVRNHGWIATNLHVVAGAKAVTVVLKDGTSFEVTEVVAVDEDRDLAILGIDAEDLPALALGDSDEVHAGDPVVAIGHPLGLEDTVSAGLISAVRDVTDELTLLQFSAPIAPGSSGGPLLDDRGRVIGIATLVHKHGQNLAFGVPVGYLKTLIVAADPVPFEEFAAAAAVEPEAPAVQRAIPKHPSSVLLGCGEGDLRLLSQLLRETIESVGPFYAQGNHAAGYHLSEGASIDVERKLAPGCRGPRKALGDARRKAASAKDPNQQVWAMRDGFDGLLEVIDRTLKK